jgi:hypothetical protein
VTSADDRREAARQTTGQFGEQQHSAPETTLSAGTSTLDAAISRVHTLHDTMLDKAEEAFVSAVPGDVTKVTLEEDDGFWDITEAIDARGLDVRYDRDFDDLTEMMQGLGDGESGMPDFLKPNRDGSYTWEHDSDTTHVPDAAAAQRAFELESARWKAERARVEQIAALTIRDLMPADVDRLVFEWSDQGPHLTLAAAYDAEGNELDTEDGDGFHSEQYEDISFISSNIGDPDAAGLTKLGGGRFAVTRESFVVSTTEHEKLRAEAESARAAVAGAANTWDAEGTAQFAEARATLTRIGDKL